MLKSKDEKPETFDREAYKVFDNLNLMGTQVSANVLMTVGEIFRYGEEVYISRDKSTLQVEMRHFKKDNPNTTSFYAQNGMLRPDGKKVDLLRISLIALLQEVGVWGELIANPDFEPKSLAFVDMNDVAFFRRCIRSARKHFQIPPDDAQSPRDLREETLLWQRSKRSY